MRKLFKMSTTCRHYATFINRVIKKIFAFCSKHSEFSPEVLCRAFKFANGSAIDSEKYFTTSCGEFIRSSSDVQFNNIRCCISYVHELFKNTAYIVEFYVDEDFELNCKVGRAIFRRSSAPAAAAPAAPAAPAPAPAAPARFFSMPCLSFKWCHAPFDTVRTCYNCSNFKSCDTPTFSDRLQIFPAIQKNLQILPAWVYKRYNINPVLTVAFPVLFRSSASSL